MRNKLTDLNDYLFEQLERLNDDSLNPEELDKEIKKAEAITNISKNIIDNANLQVKVLGIMNKSLHNRDTVGSIGKKMLGFGDEK